MALSGSFDGLFIVPPDQSFEVRRFEINSSGVGIYGDGTVKVVDSVFSGDSGRGTGIEGGGPLTVDSSTFSGCDVCIAFGSGSPADSAMVRDSTISGNGLGLSIFTGGSATLVGCTLSANSMGIVPGGFGGDGVAVTLVNSTISGSEVAIGGIDDITLINSTIAKNADAFEDVQTLNISNSVVAGECGDIAGTVTSNGYNIESPGDTCGFDQTGDQAGVTAEQLNLGPLANNGGPTMTHKPGDGGFGDGSVAVDQIPEADCEVETDQRGQPRPAGPDPKRCDVGSVEVQVPFSCTEQGILDAIAEGGGPHTFDCVGPTTVVLDEPIKVDNSVILDGGGNMALSGSFQGLFIVPADQSLEVRRFEISSSGSGILGEGTVKVVDSVFSGESGRGTGIEARGSLTVDSSTFSGGETGIAFGSGSLGELMVRDSTFSGNVFAGLSIYTGGSATLVGCTLSANGSGIVPDGFFGGGFALTLVNSTISGSTGEAIRNIDDITLINSTIVENNDAFPAFDDVQTLNISNTVVAGECGDIAGTVTSSGYNIESPGSTCGLDQTGDQSGVTEEQLNLGPLANNGGPTMTHNPGDGGLREGSVAIDQIPEADCEVDTDQRGQPRPAGPDPKRCDVGSVEVQPAP